MTRDTEVETGHLGYLLTAYAFESISEAGRREVEEHLAECAECREELAGIRGTVASVRDAYVEEKARSYSFEKRRMARVLAAGRARKRGRFAYLALPLGAAAAVLVGFLLLGTISIRGRGRSSRGPVEEFAMAVDSGSEEGADSVGAEREHFGAIRAARPPGSAGGVAAGGIAYPAAEPAQAPAALPPQDLASKIREPVKRRLNRTELAVPPETPPPPAKPAGEVAQGQAQSNERFYEASRGGRASVKNLVDSEQQVFAAGEKLDDSLGLEAVGEADEAPEVTQFDHVELEKKDAGLEEAAKSPNFQPPLLAYDALGSAGKGVQSDGSVPTPDEPARADPFAKSKLERRLKDVEQLQEIRDLDRLAGRTRGDDGVLNDPSDEVTLLAKEVKEADGVQGWAYSIPRELATIQDPSPADDSIRYARQPGNKPDANAAPPADLASRGSRERVLRAWSHWKGLDQGLSLEGFEAKRLVVPPPSPAGEGLAPEEFRARYGVNPFVDTRLDALSTFGMDVDTASYTIARGALAAGRLPRPAEVRVEEFVNYFPEELPSSKDSVFSVACEGGPSPFGAGLDLLKVAIRAREILPGERKDAVLTLAVDTSGSMHHGGRLALVREALGSLVQALEPGDRVAVVGFGDHPYLVLPHTSAREAERILDALGSLTPRGDTNFEAGLDLAYRVADEALEPKAVNRIILCSDGVATAGPRGPEDVLGKVEAYARRGVHLSCLGVGLGKYNDRLLETLADRGNGNYAYADDAPAAAEVFRKNLPATLQVLARDAKIQTVFNPEVVGRYRLLGYENRDIADKDFRNDKVDAGEVGPGTTVTVLYEIERRSGSSGDLGRIHLRYVDTGTGRVLETDYPLPPGVMATRLEDTSDRFRFIACAAEMAELLRGSYWARNGSFWDVLRVLARLGPEHRARPEVRELMGLAIRAQSLTLSRLEGK